MNIYQDEPQDVHWDHSQTVLHPIVNYYLDKEGKLVTEEHLMIFNDLKHDKFAVREFEKWSLEKLKKKGFVPKQILQFCNNCAGQYKSKGPFQLIFEAGIPTLKMFFGARHGKGLADGAVGRIKGATKKAVKSCQVIIWNAMDFWKFCTDKCSYNKYDKDSPKPQYFIQEFFFVTDVEREEEIVAVTVPNTRSFCSIRSTSKFCIIEAREISCCCKSCMEGDGSECPNQAYTSEWKVINLRTGKAVLQEDFMNYHWNWKEEIPLDEENETTSEESNVKSNADRNFEEILDLSSRDDTSTSEIDFDEIYENLNQLQTFEQLQEYVDNFDSQLPSLIKPILNAPRKCRIDDVAKFSMPPDCLVELVPLLTFGDGNCFARAVSTALYGNQPSQGDLCETCD